MDPKFQQIEDPIDRLAAKMDEMYNRLIIKLGINSTEAKVVAMQDLDCGSAVRDERVVDIPICFDEELTESGATSLAKTSESMEEVFTTVQEEEIEIPVFTGTNLCQWRVQMERIMKIYEIPDIQWVNFSSVYVDGMAKDWVVVHFEQVCWWSWEEFTNALCLQFGSHHSIQESEVGNECLIIVPICSGKESTDSDSQSPEISDIEEEIEESTNQSIIEFQGNAVSSTPSITMNGESSSDLFIRMPNESIFGCQNVFSWSEFLPDKVAVQYFDIMLQREMVCYEPLAFSYPIYMNVWWVSAVAMLSCSHGDPVSIFYKSALLRGGKTQLVAIDFFSADICENFADVCYSVECIIGLCVIHKWSWMCVRPVLGVIGNNHAIDRLISDCTSAHMFDHVCAIPVLLPQRVSKSDSGPYLKVTHVESKTLTRYRTTYHPWQEKFTRTLASSSKGGLLYNYPLYQQLVLQGQLQAKKYTVQGTVFQPSIQSNLVPTLSANDDIAFSVDTVESLAATESDDSKEWSAIFEDNNEKIDESALLVKDFIPGMDVMSADSIVFASIHSLSSLGVEVFIEAWLLTFYVRHPAFLRYWWETVIVVGHCCSGLENCEFGVIFTHEAGTETKKVEISSLGSFWFFISLDTGNQVLDIIFYSRTSRYKKVIILSIQCCSAVPGSFLIPTDIAAYINMDILMGSRYFDPGIGLSMTCIFHDDLKFYVLHVLMVCNKFSHGYSLLHEWTLKKGVLRVHIISFDAMVLMMKRSAGSEITATSILCVAVVCVSAAVQAHFFSLQKDPCGNLALPLGSSVIFLVLYSVSSWRCSLNLLKFCGVLQYSLRAVDSPAIHIMASYKSRQETNGPPLSITCRFCETLVYTTLGNWYFAKEKDSTHTRQLTYLLSVPNDEKKYTVAFENIVVVRTLELQVMLVLIGFHKSSDQSYINCPIALTVLRHLRHADELVLSKVAVGMLVGMNNGVVTFGKPSWRFDSGGYDNSVGLALQFIVFSNIFFIPKHLHLLMFILADCGGLIPMFIRLTVVSSLWCFDASIHFFWVLDSKFWSIESHVLIGRFISTWLYCWSHKEELLLDLYNKGIVLNNAKYRLVRHFLRKRGNLTEYLLSFHTSQIQSTFTSFWRNHPSRFMNPAGTALYDTSGIRQCILCYDPGGVHVYVSFNNVKHPLFENQFLTWWYQDCEQKEHLEFLPLLLHGFHKLVVVTHLYLGKFSNMLSCVSADYFCWQKLGWLPPVDCVFFTRGDGQQLLYIPTTLIATSVCLVVRLWHIAWTLRTFV